MSVVRSAKKERIFRAEQEKTSCQDQESDAHELELRDSQPPRAARM
ncbi:MAG: hypothetical protein V8T01_08345 [Oscillospiraceae bacterium]